MNNLIRFFSLLGLFFLFIAFVLFLFSKIIVGKFVLPRLPGDIYIRRENFVFYFPFATCIIISLLLTLLFSLFFRR